jgi:hypothetical protein
MISRIISLIKRVTGRDILEEQLQELAISRELLTHLLERATRPYRFEKMQKTVLEIHEDLAELVEHSDRCILMMERWINHVRDCEQTRSRMMEQSIDQWQHRSKILESIIEKFQREIDQKNIDIAYLLKMKSLGRIVTVQEEDPSQPERQGS